MCTNDSNSGRGSKTSSPLCLPSNNRLRRDECALGIHQNTTGESISTRQNLPSRRGRGLYPGVCHNCLDGLQEGGLTMVSTLKRLCTRSCCSQGIGLPEHFFEDVTCIGLLSPLRRGALDRVCIGRFEQSMSGLCLSCGL